MRIKSQRDFCSGLIFLLLGIAFAVGARNYSLGTSAQPGPGYFPLMLSVLLTILGAAVVFKALTIETEGRDRIGPIAWRPLIAIVAAIVLFGVALPRLGLLLTVALVTLISSLAGAEFRWKGVLLSAAVLAFGSWAIFVWGLKLLIPVWPPFIGA